MLNQSPHSQNDRYWSTRISRMQEGSQWKAYVGIIDGRCLPVVWFDGSVNGGSLPGESSEGHSMAKRQACCNEERILVSTRWSKLSRYLAIFVIFTIEIWRSNHLSQRATSLATIFARPFTTGLFFLEPMYAICEEREAQEHMWSPSLYWFTR